MYERSLRRSVLAADNVWFTLLTQNTAPCTSIGLHGKMESLAASRKGNLGDEAVR